MDEPMFVEDMSTEHVLWQYSAEWLRELWGVEENA